MSDYDTQAAEQYFNNKMAFTLGPVELKSQLAKSKVIVIDVRAEKDYRKAHIPGAKNLPKEKWDSPEHMAASLSKDSMNVIYCYSQVCHLAAAAAQKFASQGYQVQELEGGFNAWKDHNMATVSVNPQEVAS